MPDYSKALIYTIRSGDGLYIGSTTNFTKRKYRHNQCIEYNYQSKLYQHIKNNGGEWDMKPYKEFPCETKQQLNIEEERVRRELNADLNSCSCYGIDKEKEKKYNQEYGKKNIENRKKYLKTNAEQIKKKHQEWCDNNKEKRRESRFKSRMKKKEESKNQFLERVSMKENDKRV